MSSVFPELDLIENTAWLADKVLLWDNKVYLYQVEYERSLLVATGSTPSATHMIAMALANYLDKPLEQGHAVPS